MQHPVVRLAALAAASTVLAAGTASGNINVIPTLPGGITAPSSAPSAAGSTSASAAPSSAPSAGASAKPVSKPSAAPSATASAGTTSLGNDSFDKAYAAKIDEAITGQVTKGEKAFYFKVTVPAGTEDGWLSFDIDEADDDYAPKIAWFTANKVDMGKDTYASGTEHPKTGTIRAKAGNTYYVTIPPYANDADIAFNAKFTWAPVGDKNERNDGFDAATAAELDKAISFATFWADDQEAADHDYFKVSLPEGKTKLRVKLTNKNDDNSVTGYELTLFNGNKGEAGSTLYTESAQADLDKTWEDLTAGSYYVLVKGGNGPALSELTFSAE